MENWSKERICGMQELDLVARFIPTTLKSSSLEVRPAAKQRQNTAKDTSLPLIPGRDSLNSVKAASRPRCASSTMEVPSSASEVLNAKMPTCSTLLTVSRDWAKAKTPGNFFQFVFQLQCSIWALSLWIAKTFFSMEDLKMAQLTAPGFTALTQELKVVSSSLPNTNSLKKISS